VNAEPIVALPAHLPRSYGREMSALWALFVLTLRQHTHGRRLLVVAFLYALPCALVVLLRSLRNPPPSGALEYALVFNLLPHGLAPLTALLYASGIVQDEVEEQTLTYVLLKPLPRWGLYTAKLVATICTTSLMVACAAMALYVFIYAGKPELWSEVLPTRAPRLAALMVLGQAVYCVLFGFVGLLTRRSLIVGIAYIVAVEGILASLEFVFRKLTVVYYLRILSLRWLELPPDLQRRFLADWRLDLETAPSAGECVLYVVAVSYVLASVTALWFSRREFHVKTPEGS
jgi:ABC-2 type transport system permease protein